MKSFYLQLAFLSISLGVFAQNEAPVYKEFAQKIEGIASTLKLNDHICIVQLASDKESFELAAIDDKMQVAWRVSLQGYATGTGSLMGNIVAISHTTKSDQNFYTAYLIDEKTGKTLLQKDIYQADAQYMEFPFIYSARDGSWFKLILRKTGVKKLGFFTVKAYGETQAITAVNLDNKLNTTPANLNAPEGRFVNMTCNESGDLFVFTCQDDNNIRAVKYDAGKTTPGAAIVQDINLRNQEDIYMPKVAKVIPSQNDKNITYFAFAHKNNNKDRELTLCKFNFNTQTAQLASEVFDHDRVKELQKAFVPLDKKMDKPEIGGEANLGVNYLEEHNGLLLLSLSDQYIGSNTLGSDLPNAANTVHYIQGNAIIIDAFNTDLQPKFEQLIPVTYRWDKVLASAYHAEGDGFNILATDYRHKFGVSYAHVSLSTGKLDKFEFYSDDNHIINGDAIWFKESVVIPFMVRTGVLPPHKQTIDLQLYSY